MHGSGRGRGRHAAAEEIREKLGRFAGRPRFNDEFEEAFEFFFGESVEHLQDTLDEDDFERFMEWFVYDYRLANGHRLIEIFDLEHGSDLSRAARRLLRGWEQANLTLLELQERREDVCVLADLLTGRRYEVTVESIDPSLSRWSLIVARPLSLGTMWELSPARTVLSPVAKEAFIALLRGEYRRHRRAHGDVSVQRFLREQGYLFNDLLAELDTEESVSFLEGDETHRVVHCRALFSVRDGVKVVQRLLAYADTEMVRQGRLIWYEEPEVEQRDGRNRRVLAEVQVSGGRLQIHCWSRERLQIAKKRLSERLKGLALHLVDAFEEPQARGGANGAGVCTLKETELAALGSGRNAGPEDSGVAGRGGGGPRTLELETGAWAKSAYDDYIESWLSQPLEALDWLSPEALRSKPLGRIRLAELLKKLEHQQTSRRARGRGLLTADDLRRRLGIEADIHFCVPLGQPPEVWNSEGEARVAELIRQSFEARQLSDEHIDAALWLWWDFCYRAYPRVRKPEAWTAALHYAVSMVENWGFTQETVASLYGVSPGAVSANARRIINCLDLDPFDDRYCVEHPVEGLLERIGRIHNTAREESEDPITACLALATRVRDEVHAVSSGNEGLQERAQEHFFAHVGRSERDVVCRECFTDWFHFDWRVPVMGGRTLLQAALEQEKLSGEGRAVAEGWVNVHPSFYVVEGVNERGGAQGAASPRLNLREIVTGVVTSVDWLRIGRPLGPKEILFARLVPVAGLVVSLGPVLVLPADRRIPLQRAIEEDRALVNRWNERYINWDEFRLRYAERLYALAFQLAGEQGTDAEPEL